MKKNSLLFAALFSCTAFLFWFFKTHAILSQEQLYFINGNFLNNYANNSLYVWNQSINNGIYTFLAPFLSIILYKPIAWLALCFGYGNIFQFFAFTALLLSIPSYYFSFNKYFKNKPLFFFSSFLYVLNPWTLEQVISGHVMLMLSLPLYPIIISLFLNFLKSKNIKSLIFLYILSFFSIIISVQTFFVIALLMSLYFVYFIFKNKHLFKDRIFLIEILIFFFFLLIPILFNYIYIINLVRQTNISSSFVIDAVKIAQSQSLVNIMTLTNSQFFYSGSLYGNLRILYLLPILGLIFLLIKRKKSILAAVSLLLIIISINYYSNIIHIPLYRDMTQFLLIYTLMLPYVFYEILKSFLNTKIIYAILFLYIALGIYPYFYSNSYLKYLNIREIDSSSYEELNGLDPSAKVLFLPSWPDVKYVYNENAALTMTDFLQYNSLYGNIYYTYNDFNSIDKNLAGLHSFEDIEGIVNKFNIRYVVFRKDLSSSGYVNADELSLLHNELIKKTKLIVSNEYLDIFDFGAEEPQINGENLYYEEINPIKYKIYVKNITSTQELSFLESLNDGWKLYIDQNPTNSWCEQSQGYDNDVVECQPKQKFFEGEELTYLYKKPIFDNTHSLIDGYANGWIIDPNYIKQNFDPSYYKENPDGSIDIELTLYFKPQSYFDLGLIISGATLLACLGYLGWDFTRRRKKKLAATTTIKKEEDV